MSDRPASLLDLGLFTGIEQYENFARLPALVATKHMAPSSIPHVWPRTSTMSLPTSYRFDGREQATEMFLRDTDTTALLVVRGGEICLEEYFLTGDVGVPWISMSVAKSVVSALVGIALDEGMIDSVNTPISEYISVNTGSAYDGVSIRDVLQMSSGARWTENYNDPESDIFRLGAAMGGHGSLDDFVATMVRDVEPGSVCRYNSGDTQALGSLLVAATGRSIADYMQERLIEPLGISAPAYWLVDGTGMEVAFAGLVMTARDYALFGALYQNGGVWRGRQIVPEAWVRQSLVSDGEHLQPGRTIVGTHAFGFGYGYQWWLPGGGSGDFSAIGVYNQFVYVDPGRDVVVVKLSANRRYGTADCEEVNREHETIEFLRAISVAAAG